MTYVTIIETISKVNRKYLIGDSMSHKVKIEKITATTKVIIRSLNNVVFPITLDNKLKSFAQFRLINNYIVFIYNGILGRRELLNPSALLISIFFPPEIGGGATGAYNRAMVLKKLNYSVFILSTFPSYPTGELKGTKYRRKLFFAFGVDHQNLLLLEHQHFFCNFKYVIVAEP